MEKGASNLANLLRKLLSKKGGPDPGMHDPLIPCRRPGTTAVVGKNLCVHMYSCSALKNLRNGSERRIESRSRGLKVYTAVLIGPVRLPDPAAGYIWHANYDYRTSMSTPMSTTVSLWPVLRILNLVLNLVLYLRP